uniref:Wsv419-like protein n=1 Tax=Melicertus latisulcatus pemonivirus TaxID=2984278 RepID=A0A9C7BW01_9VIRU|nr:MAG: wsv419-like protein [Melicertus latisulcatus pemonivirus]
MLQQQQQPSTGRQCHFQQRLVLRPRRLFSSTFAPTHQRIAMLRSYIVETARRAAILLLTCAEELFFLDDFLPKKAHAHDDECITPKAVICSILSVLQIQNWWSTLFSERISRMVEQAITNPATSSQTIQLQTLFSGSSSGDPTFDIVRESMTAEMVSAAHLAGCQQQQQQQQQQQRDQSREEVFSPTLLNEYRDNATELVKTAQKLLTEIEVSMNSIMDIGAGTQSHAYVYTDV